MILNHHMLVESGYNFKTATIQIYPIVRDEVKPKADNDDERVTVSTSPVKISNKNFFYRVKNHRRSHKINI